MAEKKGLIARLFGKQEASSCCAVRIEAVPDEREAVPTAQKSPCCGMRVEAIQDESKAGDSASFKR